VTTAVERAPRRRGADAPRDEDLPLLRFIALRPGNLPRRASSKNGSRRDPIILFAERLTAEGTMAKGDLERVRGDVRDSVERAVVEVLAAAQPGRSEIMAHVTA